MGNNVKYVSAGKPKVGGAVFRAPVGTTLPTDATSDLDNAFECMGYISSDGVTFTEGRESEDVKAWGGDSVLNIQGEKTDQVKMKLIEVLNKAVLEAVHGEDNVSGNLENGMTVRINSKELDYGSWVFESILTDNVVERTVIAKAKITDVQDVVYNDSDALGYDVTATAYPNEDWDGDTRKKYIKKVSGTIGTLTVASAAGSSSGKTAITVTETKGSGNIYKYKVGTAAETVTLNQNVSTWTTWNGSDNITAENGKVITVVEATADYKAQKVGSATVVSAT